MGSLYPMSERSVSGGGAGQYPEFLLDSELQGCCFCQENCSPICHERTLKCGNDCCTLNMANLFFTGEKETENGSETEWSVFGSYGAAAAKADYRMGNRGRKRSNRSPRWEKGLPEMAW